MTMFIPVAPGRKGRRGFEFEPTRRLADLRDRYLHLRDDPETDETLRIYSRELVREIGIELRSRNARPEVSAA